MFIANKEIIKSTNGEMDFFFPEEFVSLPYYLSDLISFNLFPHARYPQQTTLRTILQMYEKDIYGSMIIE